MPQVVDSSMSAAVRTASRCARRFGGDGADIGKSVRRTHEIGIGLARHRNVGDKAAEPAYQCIVLQARLLERTSLNGLGIHLCFRCWGRLREHRAKG
jgi:hypothetical protein